MKKYDKRRQLCSRCQLRGIDVPLLVVSSAIGPIALTNEAIEESKKLMSSLVDPLTTASRSESVSGANRLVDANRMADLFGIDASWFLTRAREGRIPHNRFGKFVRFDPDEIRDFFHLEAGRHANS